METTQGNGAGTTLAHALHSTRVSIDGIFRQIGALPKSRATALAYTAAQLSKMWIGKVLQETGEPNPYPESTNAASPVIENEADVASVGEQPATPPEPVAVIKQLRADLESQIVYLSALTAQPMPSRNACLFLDQAALSAIAAKLWLGQALNEINTERTSERKN